MDDFDIQIAEFSYPFPSKSFELELNNANIEFREFIKSSSEGGMDSCVYYINNRDLEKAIEIKTKVDRENAGLELKYIHPARKIFAYISLALIFIYILYKASDLI